MEKAIAELQHLVTRALWDNLPEQTLPEQPELAALAESLHGGGHLALATTVSDLAHLGTSYGAQSLFLRIVQPIVVDIDVKGKLPAGHAQRWEESRSPEPDGRRDATNTRDDDVPIWAKREKKDDSSSWPEPDDHAGVSGGLTVEAALQAVSSRQRAEETARWVSDTLTGMIEQTLERLRQELDRESIMAMRALYACADQFFDGLLRGQRIEQEFRNLCLTSLDHTPADDGPARLASILRDLAAGGAAVRDAYETYERGATP